MALVDHRLNGLTLNLSSDAGARRQQPSWRADPQAKAISNTGATMNDATIKQTKEMSFTIADAIIAQALEIPAETATACCLEAPRS